MRKLTLLSSLIVSVPLVLLTACAGPTKAGKDARAAATDRMHRATSIIVYDQARQSFESGQFDKALKEIDEAIYRTPLEPRYWVMRGRIHLEKGRLEQSLADFNKAIEVNPNYAEAMYCAGIVHERWSADDKAIASYSAAAAADPTKVAYVLAAAEVLIASERYEEARMMLEPKLSYFENSAPMHQLLGQVAMLRDDATTAAVHYNRAILIDPSQPMVLENLVRALFESGQWSECLQSVRRLQREGKGGRTTELQRMEGRCLAMMGRSGEARVVFSEITRDHPADPQAWLDVATVAWDLGDVPRVQTAASRLLRIAPDRYESYVFLGLIEEFKGNDAAANEWFQKAIKAARASGDDPEFLLSLRNDHAGEQKSAAAREQP
ncbi:MAG: tetratricopeptide repeat protein [Phycisphaerae bacterium]|nr:tetratricopeptide repeat protein [Phycisphaerae bacterium]